MSNQVYPETKKGDRDTGGGGEKPRMKSTLEEGIKKKTERKDSMVPYTPRSCTECLILTFQGRMLTKLVFLPCIVTWPYHSVKGGGDCPKLCPGSPPGSVD